MDANKFKNTIFILTEEILKYNDENTDFFLGAGSLGNSLFFYKHSKYKDEDFFLKLALSEFEKVYESIENVNLYSNMNLVSGYAGIAWLFQYYVNQDVLEYDVDFFRFFDEAIISQCKKDEVLGRYDLFYGIIGYGSYFLQRSRYNKDYAEKYLNEIVEIINRISLKDQYGTYWFSDVFSDEKNKINIGMAHGIPSIISFLTKVYAINQNELAKDMLIKSTNWLLRLKTNNTESCSLFPYLIDKNKDYTESNNSTRIAWCYGDLTIGYVIYTLGKTINEDNFVKKGWEILNHCSKRTIEAGNTGIHDKAFCHGTSGAYYIYNKLYTTYKLNEFEDIKNYWLEKTLINSNENIDALKSYSIVNGEVKYAHDYGLINGYIGIGVTLLSHLNGESNEWDEIFML